MASKIKFDIIGEKTSVWDIEGRTEAIALFWKLAMNDDTIALSYVDPPDPLHPKPVMETGKHWRKNNLAAPESAMPFEVFAIDREIARRKSA